MSGSSRHRSSIQGCVRAREVVCSARWIQRSGRARARTADGTRDVPAIVALGYLTAVLSIADRCPETVALESRGASSLPYTELRARTGCALKSRTQPFCSRNALQGHQMRFSLGSEPGREPAQP